MSSISGTDPSTFNRGGLRRSSEPQNQSESVVDRAELVGLEPPGGAPEALWVDNRGLLDKHARALATELDLGPEGRRLSPG